MLIRVREKLRWLFVLVVKETESRQELHGAVLNNIEALWIPIEVQLAINHGYDDE